MWVCADAGNALPDIYALSYLDTIPYVDSLPDSLAHNNP